MGPGAACGDAAEADLEGLGAFVQPSSSTRTVTRCGSSQSVGRNNSLGLAAGVTFMDGDDVDAHLFGLVPAAVQTLFDHGCRPDPDDPPEIWHI